MANNEVPSARAIIDVLSADTTTRRARLAIGGCGAFFAGAALWLAIALLLIPEPRSLLWILPLSLVLGSALAAVFIAWGAASLMHFVADTEGRIRVTMGFSGVVRMSKKIGNRRYFIHDLMVGGLITLAGIGAVIVLAVLGTGRDLFLALFILPLTWLFLACGLTMIRASLGIQPTDVILESTSVSPIAAFFLRSGGSPADLKHGVAADRMVARLSDSDVAQAASVAYLLARMRDSL